MGNEKCGWFTLLWYSIYCPGLEHSLVFLWGFAVSTWLIVYIFRLKLTLGWLCSKMDKRSTVEIQWNIHLKAGFSFTPTNNVRKLLLLHFLYLLIQIYFKDHQFYEYMRISQQFYCQVDYLGYVQTFHRFTVLWRPTWPSRTNTKRDVLFIIWDWNEKVGSQEIPEVTGKFSLGVQNEGRKRLLWVLSRVHSSHSKDTLPTKQEKTLHMDISWWSILKSDRLYSL